MGSLIIASTPLSLQNRAGTGEEFGNAQLIPKHSLYLTMRVLFFVVALCSLSQSSFVDDLKESVKNVAYITGGALTVGEKKAEGGVNTMVNGMESGGYLVGGVITSPKHAKAAIRDGKFIWPGTLWFVSLADFFLFFCVNTCLQSP